MSDLSTLLPPFMTRVAGAGDLSNLTRLSGGANMESWAFEWGGGAYVLRRAPSAEYMEGRPYGHPVEAALVRAAHAGGVKAPEVIGVLSDADGMGLEAARTAATLTLLGVGLAVLLGISRPLRPWKAALAAAMGGLYAVAMAWPFARDYFELVVLSLIHI